MKLDKYLTDSFSEYSEEYPIIDTKIFKKYLVKYVNEMNKINMEIENNIMSYINLHKKYIKGDISSDTKQWLKDDVGEYFSGQIPENMLSRIYKKIDMM